MRSFLLATGTLLLAAHLHAQTASATTADTTTTAPPLIKSVAESPNDSRMVRAAKRAVASRQSAGQRRVVTLTSSGAATRGRVAVSSGSVEGPKLPPAEPKKVPQPKVISAQEEAAQKQADLQAKLKNLEMEEARIRAELDEPYGHEMDEDAVEKRLSEIQAERKKLLEAPPPG
ncbi:MAG: hypothetical protein ACJ74H_11325 [Thermoanaerobaculia bacterium]